MEVGEKMNLKIIGQINESLEMLEKQYYKQVYIFEYKNGNSIKIFSEENGFPFININFELSNKLQHIKEHRRKFKVLDLLSDIINSQNSHVVCLDYYEILFEPSLQLNPFELFKSLSRNKILVIAWRGTIDKTHFVYAKPGHPEYMKYPVDEIIIIQ